MLSGSKLHLLLPKRFPQRYVYREHSQDIHKWFVIENLNSLRNHTYTLHSLFPPSEVCEEEECSPQVFCLAITYMDRFLATTNIRRLVIVLGDAKRPLQITLSLRTFFISVNSLSDLVVRSVCHNFIKKAGKLYFQRSYQSTCLKLSSNFKDDILESLYASQY